MKAKKRAAIVAAEPWDLVIVDEAHHCKNRSTLNWQLVNSLQRRFMFLLSATPVQNNLLELYNLAHPAGPRPSANRIRFQEAVCQARQPCAMHSIANGSGRCLGEVMVRNTRSLVQINLPPRYAQTVMAKPDGAEAELYRQLTKFLRSRGSGLSNGVEAIDEAAADDAIDADIAPLAPGFAAGISAPVSRMQLSSLLAAQGSHPKAVAASLERIASTDPEAASLARLAASIVESAKDVRLLELIQQSQGHKLLIFVNFRRTLAHIRRAASIEGPDVFGVFRRADDRGKRRGGRDFSRPRADHALHGVGGEGRNLQFADTLINYDLPWNPMKIEQRIGRVHRYGQTQEVFVFNLCTADSMEARILNVLNEKIRMFELVVGEVGSILGNLEDGDQFESLVLNLWLRSRDDAELDESFVSAGRDAARSPGTIRAVQGTGRGPVWRGFSIVMSTTALDRDLQTFAVELFEHSGGVADWPVLELPGSVVVPADVVRVAELPGEEFSLDVTAGSRHAPRRSRGRIPRRGGARARRGRAARRFVLHPGALSHKP